ncbi:MAG: hypothetical protein KIS94_13705 [Chitinophagales bacterium]|nr:hypothetical protein [Chitinophagales bacterium]
MQKVLHQILLPALLVSITGMVFKLMHWAGANVLLICGLGSLSLYGLASSMVSDNIAYKAKGYTIALLSAGFLFKLMHWPGAQTILGVALVAAILTMLLLIWNRRKES